MSVMEELNRLFQDKVDMTNYRLVEDGKYHLGVIVDYMEDVGIKDTYITLMVFAGSAIAADGKFTQAEYEYLCSILRTDVDVDLLDTFIAAGAESNTVNALDEMIDGAPDEIKASFVALCMDILASDGTITPTEKLLVIKYLA